MRNPITKNNLYTALRIMGSKYLKPDYRNNWTKECPVTGYCYVVCEALHYFDNSLISYIIKINKGTHWFLKDRVGNIIDYTAEQFNHKLDYTLGKRCNFLTRNPSKRAQKLIELLIQGNK